VKTFPIDPTDALRALTGSRCAGEATFTLSPGEADRRPGHAADPGRWLYVKAGSGRARVAGTSVALEPGLLLWIEPCEAHEISNPGPDFLEALTLDCEAGRGLPLARGVV
jgi:mannose-6-phosphate isomerase-like protein (cupin superfamily)